MSKKGRPKQSAFFLIGDWILFVDLEFFVAVDEEVHNLVGGGEAGIDVGFGGFGTLFFRGGEEAFLKLVELVQSVGGDVGAVFEVFALSHQGDEFFLVDDLFAGGVDHAAAFGHKADKSFVDRLFGLVIGGDVQGDVVAVFVHLFEGGGNDHAFSLHFLFRDERVEGPDFHAEGAGFLSDEAADVAVSLDTDFFAFQFGAGAGFEGVAGHVDHHAEGEFSHSIGVLAGGVHSHDVVGGAGGEVEVVEAGAGAHDHRFRIFPAEPIRILLFPRWRECHPQRLSRKAFALQLILSLLYLI